MYQNFHLSFYDSNQQITIYIFSLIGAILFVYEFNLIKILACNSQCGICVVGK